MKGSFEMVALLDAAIVITLVEMTVLAFYRRRTGRGVALRDFVANMLSGLCLMLALRCMASDASGAAVGAFLLCAGLAHGSDILMRLRRSEPAAATAGAAR